MSSTLIHTTHSTDAGGEGESRSLMAELSIVHDGRYYRYGGYRYERLADAAAYARLVRARGPEGTDSPAFVQIDAVESPNTADRQLMLELSISLENGSFVYGGYHYDRLIDAANYARHRQQVDLQTR